MPKGKLKPGFDPIWQSDLLDLRRMNRTAYILRQIYRLYRDPKTNLVNLSDYTIKAITGWHRESIIKARHQLIALKEIIPQGYHAFKLSPFHQMKSSTENVLPQNDDQYGKRTTSSTETVPDQYGNRTTSSTETAQPLLTDTRDKDIKDTFSSSSPVKKPVNNSTVLCCKDCANYLRDPADRDNKRSSPCSILKIKLPPFTMAAHCENFSNRFEK
jgi:hypothetical protein